MMTVEHIKVGNNKFEKVKIFKYLGSLLTNQNFIHKETNVELKQEMNVITEFRTLLE